MFVFLRGFIGLPAGPGAVGPLVRLIAAFAAVYFIWGSTYLAIRFAIETLPPFLMAGARFTAAGLLLYGWLRLRGAPRPSPAHWRAALVVGGLMLVGGNGALSWAEQIVPSGVAALIIATVPVWMVLLEAVRRGGDRPGGVIVGGLLLGTVGVALLVGPRGLLAGEPVNPVGAVVLLGASFFWALGSLRSRGLSIDGAPLLATALVMLCGGLELIAAGALMGELGRVEPTAISTRSALALAYLIFFGSIVAYSAYLWLMRNTTPARVATYAYVNPIVALLLGFAFAGEPLTARTLGAAALIVGSVVLIQVGRSSARAAARAAARTPDAESPDDLMATDRPADAGRRADAKPAVTAAEAECPERMRRAAI